MKQWKLGLISVIVLVSFLLISCGSATPAPTPTPTVHPGVMLVKERCSTCHDLGRVETEKLSREGWQDVVNRMVLSGASLNSEEETQVIDYLAITYPSQ